MALGATHARPQVPQLVTSRVPSVSQPSGAPPLQLIQPLSHEPTPQAPFSQDGLPWSAGQVIPHLPQFAGSESRLAQRPAQQVLPAPQGMLQPPQWSGSFITSTHLPRQQEPPPLQSMLARQVPARSAGGRRSSGAFTTDWSGTGACVMSSGVAVAPQPGHASDASAAAAIRWKLPPGAKNRRLILSSSFVADPGARCDRSHNAGHPACDRRGIVEATISEQVM